MKQRAILVMATLAAMSVGIALPAAQVAKGLTGTWMEAGTPDRNKVMQGTTDKTLHFKGRVLDLPELDQPRSEAHLHA